MADEMSLDQYLAAMEAACLMTTNQILGILDFLTPDQLLKVQARAEELLRPISPSQLQGGSPKGTTLLMLKQEVLDKIIEKIIDDATSASSYIWLENRQSSKRRMPAVMQVCKKLRQDCSQIMDKKMKFATEVTYPDFSHVEFKRMKRWTEVISSPCHGFSFKLHVCLLRDRASKDEAYDMARDIAEELEIEGNLVKVESRTGRQDKWFWVDGHGNIEPFT